MVWVLGLGCNGIVACWSSRSPPFPLHGGVETFSGRLRLGRDGVSCTSSDLARVGARLVIHEEGTSPRDMSDKMAASSRTRCERRRAAA